MPGPSNLYGVANPVILPIAASIPGPVTCTVAVETTIAASPALIAPSGGYFYPMLWFDFTFGTSATPPSAATVAGKIGAGSDFDSAYYSVLSGFTSTYVFLSGALVGPASNTAWQPPGSVVNLTVLAATNSVGAYNIHWLVTLFRAPDQ